MELITHWEFLAVDGSPYPGVCKGLERSYGSLIDLKLSKPSRCSYEISYIGKAFSLAKLAS